MAKEIDSSRGEYNLLVSGEEGHGFLRRSMELQWNKTYFLSSMLDYPESIFTRSLSGQLIGVVLSQTFSKEYVFCSTGSFHSENKTDKTFFTKSLCFIVFIEGRPAPIGVGKEAPRLFLRIDIDWVELRSQKMLLERNTNY